MGGFAECAVMARPILLHLLRSPTGTKRPFADVRAIVAIEGKAVIGRIAVK